MFSAGLGYLNLSVLLVLIVVIFEEVAGFPPQFPFGSFGGSFGGGFGGQFRRNYCNCECGTVNRQMRVVGGNVTRVNEFPWMASLSYKGAFQCGAALITRKHVITAAHCVSPFESDLENVEISLGDHDRNQEDHFIKQSRGVRRARQHEGFDGSVGFNNDIAVIELDAPINFNHKIMPVCLPSEDFVDYAGKIGIVTGWGRVSEHGEPSNVLRKIAVPIWSQKDCVNSGYGEKKITTNMFCAGYPEGEVDSCRGDSGGPFQLSNSLGDMEIVGVVSYGRGCARPNLPGVYTRVVNYLPWVEETIQGECLCQSSGFNSFYGKK